jgi:hypothetical protein
VYEDSGEQAGSAKNEARTSVGVVFSQLGGLRL